MNKSFPIFTVGAIVFVALYYFFSDGEESVQETIVEENIKSPIVSSSSVGLIDDERIIKAESEPGNWIAHGRTYEEQRFSPLSKINKVSVTELGLAWYLSLIHI